MRKSSAAKRAALATSTVAATEIVNVPAIIADETPASADSNAIATVTNSEIVGSGIVIDNATGDTVAPEADTSEAPVATPDPRVARAERIAADRAAIRAIYAAVEAGRSSVPIKAVSAFKLATSSAHPNSRGASIRQASALAIGLAASGKKLADGVKFPRVFEINGVNSAIENGVLRDAISAGLITVSGATPEAEIITLARKASATISGLLGASVIKAGNLA